ncbi:MAG: hypothetical protein WAL64_05290 [Candidatus Dormiibacterota bacterium]
MGIQRAQLLGLRRQDVDWQNSELHVFRQLQRTADIYELGEVKSRKSKQALPLTPAELEALSD